MQKNIIIIIILVLVSLGALLFYTKNKTTSVEKSSENMQGVDMSMPGMDHSKMQMGQ